MSTKELNYYNAKIIRLSQRTKYFSWYF